MAERLVFFDWPGALLLLVGLSLLAGSSLLPASAPAQGALAVLFVVMAVLAALAPFDPAGPNPLEAGLTIGAALAFYTLGLVDGGRAYRLPAAALLLVAAHVAYLLRFPHPLHQDVFLFLNGGVDLLVRGVDPYRGVPIVEAGIHKVLSYTYPPGALLTLAPFRLMFGDVRWAYPLAELAVALAWWRVLVRRGLSGRGREAMVLIPLALPRTSQAFYIFSNHEWVLLALVLGALALAPTRWWPAAALLLGLAISAKQYVLVFPVLFLVRTIGWRTLGGATLVALVVTLPFLAWDPHAFLAGTLGNLASTAPQADRITFYAILAHLGIVAPRLLLTAMSAATLGLAGWLAWRTRKDPGRALVACGLTLCLFALCSTFSAYNYFAYGLVFVTWGLILGAAPVVSGYEPDAQPEPELLTGWGRTAAQG